MFIKDKRYRSNTDINEYSMLLSYDPDIMNMFTNTPDTIPKGNYISILK
jgi:hypothetical protein